MDSPEHILCAAIWYKDYPVPERLNSNLLPVNLTKGIVFCGHRHPHCLRQMNVVWGRRQCEAGKEVQGFLTSKNRFVDRKEAWIIAEKQNQIIRVSGGEGTLYSEDIY